MPRPYIVTPKDPNDLATAIKLDKQPLLEVLFKGVRWLAKHGRNPSSRIVEKKFRHDKWEGNNGIRQYTRAIPS